MTKDTLLIVNSFGPDRPGIVAAFLKVLLEYEIEIVDIELVSLQNTLGMHLLLRLKETGKFQERVIKDLLFEGSKHNLTLTYQLISEDKLHTVRPRKFMILTHFGDTRSVAELSNLMGEENVNIEFISSHSHHAARSFEMTINIGDHRNVDRLKNRLMIKSRELNIDLAIQSMAAYRKNKRMICFDMDSTLVNMEGIDEMARKAGVHREVARITEKAMRGDFDFEESLRQRVAMLKGLALDEVMDIRNHMMLSEGADELLTTLKWLGFKLGIVSGGFDIFADYLKDRFNLDFAFANQLDFKSGALTGKLNGDIVDAAQKARILNQVACDLVIPLDQVVAIGDGANDALMLTQAGLGIAYNAKKGLDRVANVALSEANFNHVFHLLGISEEDIQEAMSCNTT
ncbi:phosphoserine phosphatase SerB [Thermodesulfobacteriota bacterium]